MHSANVFCELVGELASSGRIPLENNSKNFERGRADIFNLQASYLGPLKNILIGHDNRGLVCISPFASQPSPHPRQRGPAGLCGRVPGGTWKK